MKSGKEGTLHILLNLTLIATCGITIFIAIKVFTKHETVHHTKGSIPSRVSTENEQHEVKAVYLNKEKKQLTKYLKKYKKRETISTLDAKNICLLLSESESELDIVGDEGHYQYWGTAVDLNNDTQLELLIKALWSGTGHGFELIILERRQDNLLAFMFSGSERGYSVIKIDWQDEGKSIGSYLEDLDKDGIPEVIIPDTTEYRGAGTVGNWPTIYKRQGDAYVVADQQFPNFYKERVLPMFQDQIIPEDRIQNEGDREWNEDCQAIIEQVHRIVKESGKK